MVEIEKFLEKEVEIIPQDLKPIFKRATKGDIDQVSMTMSYMAYAYGKGFTEYAERALDDWPTGELGGGHVVGQILALTARSARSKIALFSIATGPVRSGLAECNPPPLLDGSRHCRSPNSPDASVSPAQSGGKIPARTSR